MWQVTTNTSHRNVPQSAHKNGFVTGDWEVITASQQEWSKVLPSREQQTFPVSEIDELVEVLGNLKPEARHVIPTSIVSQTVKRSPTRVNYSILPKQVLQAKSANQNAASVASRIFNELAVPRQADAPEPSPLSPEVREQLLKLRATIMVEAEQRKLRSVLICGAAPDVSAQPVAADLSQLISEHKRLKIAYLEVSETSASIHRNKVLPADYSFRIKRTRTQNLYEIASSMGTVKLDDWLKNWTPSVVLGELEKMFDLVLIYAPAVTSHPEVALLAGAVDGVILVATENVTSFASLGEAQQRLRSAQANVLGVTLNKARSTPSPLSVVKSRMRGLMNFIAVIT